MTTRCTGLVVSGLLTVMLAAGGCASGVAPQQAAATASLEPDTSRLYRTYEYYPNAQVYYSSFQRMYYWQESGEWQCGPSLPRGIRLSRFDRELIMLPTATPPKFHDEVVAKYPSLDELQARRAAAKRDWVAEYEQIVTAPIEE